MIVCYRMAVMNNTDHNSSDCVDEARHNKKELTDAALNFGHFIYELWIEWRKREIMKMDKTIYDNEESTDTN